MFESVFAVTAFSFSPDESSSFDFDTMIRNITETVVSALNTLFIALACD